MIIIHKTLVWSEELKAYLFIYPRIRFIFNKNFFPDVRKKDTEKYEWQYKTEVRIHYVYTEYENTMGIRFSTRDFSVYPKQA